MPRIAEIVIDRPVEGLDRTFDYLIPPELEQRIGVGSKVVVSFGRSKAQDTTSMSFEKSLCVGVVLNLKDSSEFEKLKPVQFLLVEPPLSGDLIRLARF